MIETLARGSEYTFNTMFYYCFAEISIFMISLHFVYLFVYAEQDPESPFPNDMFRFGIIPAGSTDAIVIWYFQLCLYLNSYFSAIMHLKVLRVSTFISKGPLYIFYFEKPLKY